ncbi:fasciclin domain-containing protein [Albidovulum sp.]
MFRMTRLATSAALSMAAATLAFATAATLALAPVPAIAGAQMKKDIVDTAVEAGSFDTLVAAVQAAGLVETLKGEGPFTVFAPTDDAFAKLPAGTVEELLKPENKDKLTAILTYHVVPGKVMSADLKDGMMARTVQGQEVKFSLMGGARANDANIVQADIETSNGVIHVIDTVILPAE